MEVHKACHQTKNDGKSHFQHGGNGVCSEEQDKEDYCCHWIKNVWSKSVEASFHMTIVDCVSSNGFPVPPLFVLLCQQLNHASIYHCSITIITETVDTKGLTNSNIFIKWLDHFSSNVLSHVGRPIALVYNDYGSHYNTDHVEKLIELRIILVLLPSNSTHLIQPLNTDMSRQPDSR